MADEEQIRQYYNLTEEYSTEWTEPNTFSEMDLDSTTGTSKYALLRQLVSARSSTVSDIPHDEPDPLGSTTSVVSVLQSRGINVSDPAKRNKYLISSTTFEPRLFLRDIHSNATYENLSNSLGYLESSISERSEALRYLIDHDSDCFVQAKSSLDSVFRNIQSAAFNDSESSLGFHHLQSLIDESNAKAAIMTKPVLDNKSKTDRLEMALSLVENNKYLFNLPSLILSHIKNNDHDSLVRDYRRGKDIMSNENGMLPSFGDLADTIGKQNVLQRIWNQVEEIVDEYKKQTWKKLAESSAEQNYMFAIIKQLELGVEDNPITEWILAQSQYFQNEFTEIFNKLDLATVHYRNNIIMDHSNRDAILINALKKLADMNQTSDSKTNTTPFSPNQTSVIYDSAGVLEMWITIQLIFDKINSIISRYCVFWLKTLEFLNGIPQRTLPTGWKNESKSYLTFNANELEDIKKSNSKVIEAVSTYVQSFFTEQVSLTGDGQGPTNRINDDINQNQPGNESNGEIETAISKFIPPFSNVLSTSRYLTSILFSVATGLNNLSATLQSPETTIILRSVLITVREKVANAVFVAWKQDASVFGLVNTRSFVFESHYTRAPQYFYAYHDTVISGIQNMLNMANEHGQLIGGNIVSPLSTFLISETQSSFFSSVSATLDYIMKTAFPTEMEKSQASPLSKENGHFQYENFRELLPENVTEDKMILFVMSSLDEIRDTKLPLLFTTMEKATRLNPREASLQLKNEIESMAETLFDFYNRRKKTILARILRHGILKSNIQWSCNDTATPTQVSSYVYECLLIFVTIHSQVSEVSFGHLAKVISVLYEHCIETLLACYREIEQFGRFGLLQVFADIGLVRVTMDRFQTPEMLQTYSHLYDYVKKATINSTSLWETSTPPWEIVHPLVLEARNSSKIEFECFSSL